MAVDTVEADVGVVRKTIDGGAVAHGARDLVQGASEQAIAQGGGVADEVRTFILREVEGGAQAHDARDVLRTGAAVTLLPAAGLLREEGGAAPQVEEAGALGPAELVRGEAEQVDIQGLDVEWELAGRLDGVGVEGDAAVQGGASPADGLGDLGDGLQGAHLVVGEHDVDERGVRVHGVDDGAGADRAFGVDGNVGDLEAEALQIIAGVQGGVMLNGRGDDAVPRPGQTLREGDALERAVDGLRAAAGEDQLAGPGVENGGCHRARGVNGGRGGASERVEAAGVPETLGGKGRHGRSNLRAYGGGRCVVDVDAVPHSARLFARSQSPRGFVSGPPFGARAGARR